MGVLAFLDRHVGVDGGGAKLGVPQHDLDKADVAAILRKMGAEHEGMAEQVAAPCFTDPVLYRIGAVGTGQIGSDKGS
jgi:hypothetical protein